MKYKALYLVAPNILPTLKFVVRTRVRTHAHEPIQRTVNVVGYKVNYKWLLTLKIECSKSEMFDQEVVFCLQT